MSIPRAVSVLGRERDHGAACAVETSTAAGTKRGGVSKYAAVGYRAIATGDCDGAVAAVTDDVGGVVASP